ncbi:unnamed protein product [Nezara viridula]|uniref:Odorant receptor n=1 Tax=Nezara viridula TaxID=85310 RepID=A0A9P0MWZ3_NEZVI|nr:unnamed protein product [Nezara viridula]
MLTLYYMLFKERLKMFSENCNALNYNIMNAELDHSDFFKDTYLQVSNSNNKFTRNVLFFVFWTPVIYCVPTPIIDLCNGEYRRHHPLTISYPYDDHSPGIYEITFFLQMLGILYGDMKKFANDCFFLTVFRIHTVYLKYLSASMRSLGKEFGKYDDAVVKRKLITWLKLHDNLVRNVSELISLYAPVICIYYANLICMVVFGIFTQIKHESGSLESIGLSAFCFVNLFQLYMQCSTNEEVGAEANKLASEIYNTPWYEVNKTNKDIIRLIQRMANRPVDITAYRAPTLRLNKESFLAFITSTITAVVAFSKMSEIHQ